MNLIKKCPLCQENKLHYPHKRKGARSYCIDCEKKRGRNAFRENKKRLVDIFGGKCENCGLVDHPCVFDFHHKDPSEKDFCITTSINLKKILEEAKKCTLLCVFCHKRIHANQEKLVKIPENHIVKLCKKCNIINPHRLKKRRDYNSILDILKRKTQVLENMKQMWKTGLEIEKKLVEISPCSENKKNILCLETFGFTYRNALDYINLYKKYNIDNLPLSLNQMKGRGTGTKTASVDKFYYPSSVCIYCKNKKNREEKREIKTKAIQQAGGKCELCGFNEEEFLFAFHHKEPNKKDFDIGKYHKWDTKLERELEKCALLCFKCHRKMHYGLVFIGDV